MPGVDPKLWGPSAWRFIHYVCMGAPEQLTLDDQTKYRAFFAALGDILPCQACRVHFQENLAKKPIELATRDALFKWSVDIHNLVNEMTGKTVRYTSEQAMKELLTPPSGKKQEHASIPVWPFAVAFILFLASMVMIMKLRG